MFKGGDRFINFKGLPQAIHLTVCWPSLMLRLFSTRPENRVTKTSHDLWVSAQKLEFFSAVHRVEEVLLQSQC